jgi:hypothetical protein
MDKFLSDQRKVVFLGAVLMAFGSWGSGFKNWSECFTTAGIFGLCGVMGSLLLSNLAGNVLKKPPTITTTTEPESTVITTITTPPQGK